MKTKNTFFLLLVLFPIFCFSQDGTLDTSFGESGFTITDFNHQTDISYGFALQSDEKIIVIGIVQDDFDVYSAISRYLPNGYLDVDFGDNGFITYFNEDYDQNLIDIKILDDDTFLVGGTNNDPFPSTWSEIIIAKYLPNGLYDTTFGTEGVLTINISETYDNLKSLFLQDDGKIIVISSSEYESQKQPTLSRYQANGELDTSFGDNGIVITNGNYNILGKAIWLPDEKILLPVKSNNHLKLIKYLNDGSLDANFGNNGILDTNIIDENLHSSVVTLTNDGKILVGYSIECIQNPQELPSYCPTLTQFDIDGLLDTTFGNNGSIEIDSYFILNTIIVQHNNRILISGNKPTIEANHFNMMRYLGNGNFDSSFVVEQIPGWDFIVNGKILLQDDGKILAGGNTFWMGDNYQDILLARYHNDPLSIEDQKLEKLSVYPNPSNGIFNIQHKNLIEDTNYQITDILGKTIKTGVLNNNQTIINLSTVNAGVYYLTVNQKTIKLIKN